MPGIDIDIEIESFDSIDIDIDLVDLIKHLAGQHSQQTHGRGKGMGVAVKNEDGEWAMANGDKLPKHIPRIPPAWSNVKVALDSKADLLVTGRDTKGRKQSVYSANHATKQAKIKFRKIKELRKKSQQIERELIRDSKSKDPETADSAAALLLIHKTGIRPGSSRDTKADKQAYGATTLEGRHVHLDKDGGVRLKFTGKKGVELDIPVSDPPVVSMLKSRKESAGDTGKLFNVSASQLRGYSKKKDGGGFNPKDFRTAKGTSVALEMVAKMGIPTTKKEYKSLVKRVATAVAKVLGNTPAIALSSYIDPVVFAKWRVD